VSFDDVIEAPRRRKVGLVQPPRLIQILITKPLGLYAVRPGSEALT
jgi:hypothetical protein